MDQLNSPEPFYEADIVTHVVHHKDELDNKMINEYTVKQTLGQGSFGKVRRVTRKFISEEGGPEEQADYAMKIFNRTILANHRTCFYEDNGKVPRMTNMLEFADNEINIWKYFDDPNVAKLYQILDDPTDEKNCFYAITQLGELGSLMNYDDHSNSFKRNTKIVAYFSKEYEIPETELEPLAAKIFKQIAQGIRYLHQELIVCRDIKVDNIICTEQYGRDEAIKLIDFSTARQLKNKDAYLFDCAGTLGFRAPEQQFCLDDGYQALPCDIWSFGISLYCYLNELLPFWAESELEIDLKAKKNPIEYKPHNSMLVKELIDRCCAKVPQERPNILEVLEHPFFAQ